MVDVSTAGGTDGEGDDGEPIHSRVAEDVDTFVLAPVGNSPAEQLLFAGPDGVDSYGLLELEYQARPDRLDDRWGACFFTMHRIVKVDVLFRVDVGDSPTADDDRYGVREQRATHDEDTGRARTTDEFMW